MSSLEVEHRNIAVSMRKSVENLVMTSQDIGQSISQALSLSGVLPHASHPAHTPHLLDNRTVSRSPSPCRSALEPAIPESADDDKADNVSVGSEAGAGGAARGGSGRAKKKSWYSALYPTYKSRSDDFKRLFKDLPDEERLIVDYSCALQKDILAHGRLYASQNYLCFYANIFGWESTVALRWKEVTAITKEKTALVIPNAILVCTETEKHFLASFSGRDKAYLMLFRVWQNALMDQHMSSQEIWHWVHSCYGEELGFNSEDECVREPIDDDKMAACIIEEPVLRATGGGGAAEDAVSRYSLPAGGSEHAPPLARSASQPHPDRQHHSAGGEEAGGGAQGEGDALPTDLSDTSDSDPDKPQQSGESGCADAHCGRSLLQLEVAVNIDQLFTMLFTNSKFCLELLAARSTTDYIQSVWKHDADTGLKCRQVSYTLALTQPIGPKCVHVTETQVMNNCCSPGRMYSVDISSENAGVPYADSFYVVTHYCLQRRQDRLTHLAIYCTIKYKKTVWGIVKGFIEKNTWNGLEEYGRLLEAALLRETEGERAAGKRTKRRRRALSSSPPERAPTLPLPAAPRGSLVGAAPLRTAAPSSRWLFAILTVLLLLNLLLYWRLYHVTLPAHTPAEMPESVHGEEWSRVLRHASASRRQQLQTWRHSLIQTAHMLRQAEEALSKLLDTIRTSGEAGAEEPSSAPHGEL